MKIAVLRGGPSLRYDASLQTGEFVLSHLRKEPEKYRPVDIFVSRDGEWHLAGRKLPPYMALGGVDMVWNALNADQDYVSGVAKFLHDLHIRHTGPEAFGLALSINQDLTRSTYGLHALPTARHEVLEGQVSLEELLRIFRTYIHPVVIKPSRSGGVEPVIVQNFEELKEAVAKAFNYAEKVIVEESIKGRRAMCAVVENLRDQKLYSLLPQPNVFKPEEHKMIEHMAKRAHEVLGLRHYSASEFVVTPKGKIYILETNALPEITKNSDLVKSLSSVGMNPKAFIEHVVSLAA